jgi:hypothetical protein
MQRSNEEIFAKAADADRIVAANLEPEAQRLLGACMRCAKVFGKPSAVDMKALAKAVKLKEILVPSANGMVPEVIMNDAAVYMSVLDFPSDLGPRICALIEAMEGLPWYPDPRLGLIGGGK